MAEADDVRRIALSLPHVEEIDSDGFDFRVSAPVSTAALAVAVADAGRVGSITTLGMSPAQVGKVLGGMAARTTGVLAVNFLTGDIDPEAAATVRIVDFFWADPDPALVEVAHRGGALACWQVGSLAEARAAADAGCDVVAVQGTEAGGHVREHSPLLPLLESVRCATWPATRWARRRLAGRPAQRARVIRLMWLSTGSSKRFFSCILSWVDVRRSPPWHPANPHTCWYRCTARRAGRPG